MPLHLVMLSGQVERFGRLSTQDHGQSAGNPSIREGQDFFSCNSYTSWKFPFLRGGKALSFYGKYSVISAGEKVFICFEKVQAVPGRAQLSDHGHRGPLVEAPV